LRFSHLQLGAAISQQGKPIAFYIRKLNPVEKRYTTTEGNYSIFFETLRNFKTSY
jgi:hypothetical protein